MIHFFELIFVYGARCDQLLLLFYLHRGIHVFWASQETPVAKKPPADAGDAGFDPWVRKISWRRTWQHTPVFLLGKFHAQRSLAVHGVAKSQTQLSMCVCLCTHIHACACAHTHTHIQVFQHHLLFHIACGILVL